MSLSNLPHPFAEFLTAVRSGDDAALSATLADEVLMSVDGTEVRGKAAVRAWFTTSHVHWTRPPRPINDARRRGVLVLTMLTAERDHGGSERLVQQDWSLDAQGGGVREIRCEGSPALHLPHPVDAYVRATNTGDLEALIAVFHDEAIVNDQLQLYDGLAAIREWAAVEIIGKDLTMHPVSAIERLNYVAVAANVNGSMIAAGMPDPLVLRFHFSMSGARVASLIILRDVSEA